MSAVHAIVWLDHFEARIISFSVDQAKTFEVHNQSAERNIHRKAGSIGSGHAADDHHFFDEIAGSLVGIHEVLIVGPGNAKTAFTTYVDKRHPDLQRRVVGIETMDHPTDGELLAHARKSFTAIDQMGVSES
ncbi:MAG: translational machinery protein [Ilumatobacteraceae bacterium]